MFEVTGSGSNYVEVTNASGAVESNKTIGNGYMVKGAKWTKPAGLHHATVEVQAGGGAGASVNGAGAETAYAGGGGGGYSFKLYGTSSLSATESFVVGVGGIGVTNSAGTAGGRTVFKSIIASAGAGGSGLTSPGAGGTSTGGDYNLTGGAAQNGSLADDQGGFQGFNKFGPGGYGAGSPGIYVASGTQLAATAQTGTIIITEYYMPAY